MALSPRGDWITAKAPLKLTPKAYLFLFVASDGSSANELADKFISLHEMRDGMLIELAR